jgi:tripartite-type tricarboxylate transporter receptor subunit TctC
MAMRLRRVLIALQIIAVVPAVAENVMAQSYPSRPITIVVPYAAGAAPDTVGRIIAERMRSSLGQSVILEHAPGAAGTVGTGRVARAAPDGYTLVEGNWSTHVANGAIYQLHYDLRDDFAPIALIASSPLVIAGRKDIPAGTLQELIAWLRSRPDKATEWTNGPGSIMHVAGLLLQRETNTRFQFIPYRGAATAMPDLLAGRIDLSIGLPPELIPQARTGNLKAFAVTGNERLEAAPNIPTVDEAGVPELYVSAWFGLWAPKSTPGEVIAKLNAAVVDALADPAVRQQLTDIGLTAPPRDRQSPQALAAFQKAEIDKWWPIIKQADIKPE